MNQFFTVWQRRWLQIHRRHATPAPFLATRRRLFLMDVFVVTLILTIMASAIYVTDAHAIDQQIDQQLRAHVTHEAPSSLFADNFTSVDMDNHNGIEQYEPSSPNIFTIALDPTMQVRFDPGNVHPLGLPYLPAARAVQAGQHMSVIMTMEQGTHEFRLYTVPVWLNGHIAGALQVGISLEAREQQLHALLSTIGIIGLVMLLITGLASWLLADRALEPARLAFARQHQFAVAASHELRTPLAVVGSQADLIARQLRRSPVPMPAPAGLAADVAEIQEEVAYMTRLVHDLLALARDPTEIHTASHEIVDLSAVVLSVTAKLAPLATAHALTLTANAGGSTCIMGDEDRLRQVMSILIENAICYTPAGGSVTVSIQVAPGPRLLGGHGGHVKVAVQDTGIGIAQQHVARIFEPFYRINATRTMNEHASAGLGLALARWIVDGLGGNISVTSVLGEGSTFTITLPMVATSPNP